VAKLDLLDARWLAFVTTHRDAGPFHQPSWQALLAECYGFESFVLVVVDDSGQITCGLPVVTAGRRSRRRWVSLPFTDFCRPLISASEDPALVAASLTDARRAAGIHSLEVRGRLPSGEAWTVPFGFRHTVALQADTEAVYARFHASQVQRSIRRAVREGIVVRRVRSPQEFLNTFYRLHSVTRRRLGVPVQPVRFFELLWARLIEADSGFVLVACLGSRPVASAVFLVANGQIVYKYSASDPKSPQLRATHAVIWEAIQWGCSHGCHELDFGSTDAENAGLRAFKSRWGACEKPLEYTVFANRRPRPSRGRAHRTLRPIIRHSPVWFARALGAAAYRYTA
jgi:CelD/BcsL family acetyltransferase involved in cellulose biosynthesis